MLEIVDRHGGRNCQGMTRRSALRIGMSGLLGMSSAGLARLRAEGAAANNGKSVILLWLDGGPSHMESYDPKPDAPREYRGPWKDMPTNVPGIHLSEKLPHHAKQADKMAFLRSVHHDTGDHFSGAHWMLTGRGGASGRDKEPKFPSVGSYVSRVRGPNVSGMPAYMGLPAAQSIYLFPGYQGASYLGQRYNPFDVQPNQKYMGPGKGKIQEPACLGLLSGDVRRLRGRMELLTDLDRLRRDVDTSGLMQAMDRYTQEAADVILGGRARDALTVDKEDDALRERYGRNVWGHYTLMARRLVEAGVTFVTVDMPHWDDHANLEKGIVPKLAAMDQAASALVEDLADRGLLEDVLVLVMGEFGRTPRINKGLPNVPIPGRDHWGNVFSVMMAGGGVKGGQVVGASDSKAEYPVERPLIPGDILSTVYHVLGMDPEQTFEDHSQRPVAMLDAGRPIWEIL
jgi:hypothetical protein